MNNGDDSSKSGPFTLFGLDIYLLAFIALGGSFVLLGVFWLFFTNWPLPRYCGGGKRAYHCGWIERAPAAPQTNAR